MLLICIAVLLWLLVLAAVLGVCGLAAEADAREDGIAAETLAGRRGVSRRTARSAPPTVAAR